MTTVSSSGDVGDLFLEMASLIQLSRVRLVLYPHLQVREPFWPDKVDKLRPLLERQPYIEEVVYQDHREGIILDFWRNDYNNLTNIADACAARLDLQPWPHAQPWIFCDEPNSVAPIVFHRSNRYTGFFDWKPVVDKYKEAIFIGGPAEHARFQLKFGKVPYYPTKDWWETARVISGAKLFVGNQSGPMCLALALNRTKILQEVYPFVANVVFHRPNAWYCGLDSKNVTPYLPEVE